MDLAHGLVMSAFAPAITDGLFGAGVLRRREVVDIPPAAFLRPRALRDTLRFFHPFPAAMK